HPAAGPRPPTALTSELTERPRRALPAPGEVEHGPLAHPRRPQPNDGPRRTSYPPAPLWKSAILPGEVLLRRDPDLRRVGPMRMPEARGELVVEALPKPLPTLEHLRIRHPDGGLLSEEETLALIDDLNGQPDVLSAEPNGWATPSVIPNDPAYLDMWHLQMIHLEQAWDRQPNAGRVAVAVLDTGIIFDHPDLQENLLPGADLLSDPAQ